MFKILTRARVLWVLLPLALLATANSNAEPMTFSYTFEGMPFQPFAAGAVLTGTIDGTIDPMNPDIVYVNSFGPVRFIRPGLPIFNYASIDSTEFNTIPSGQMTVMSFSGSILDFRSCPLGFTMFLPPSNTPPFDDCPFAFAPGGGFGISYNFLPGAGGFASAADGTGNTELCSDGPDGPPPTLPVVERPTYQFTRKIGAWSDTVLTPMWSRSTCALPEPLRPISCTWTRRPALL